MFPRRLRVRPPRPRPVVVQDSFNAPLYSLKAFAVATAIVLTTASVSVAGVMTCLDVHNTAEFAARMRAWVSHSMPLLTAKIYRPSGDFVSTTASDHDVAEQRLSDAFDKGGLDAWTEAAAQELEAEAEVERTKRRTAG